MSQSLASYLEQLNSAESNQGIYVNPKDLDDFKIKPSHYDYKDGYVYIGSLENLSYGSQSESEALDQIIERNPRTGRGEFQFKGKKVVCNIVAMKDAYFDGCLHRELHEFLEKQVDELCAEWSQELASNKVYELEQFFAKAGEYEQQIKQQELEAALWESYYESEIESYA